MSNDSIRTVVAIGCVLGATYIHYSGTLPFALGIFVWLLLAMATGYMRPSGWLLLIAPFPWIVGVGGGVLTGQYDTFGEIWLLPLLLSTIAGTIGIIFGTTARRGRTPAQEDKS